MRIYRGDTFEFDFSALLADGKTLHTFEAGDVIKAGLKNKIGDTNYMLFEEIRVTESTQVVTFSFSHERTMELVPKEDCVLEVELTNTAGIVSTLYQNEIEIAGDVINE